MRRSLVPGSGPPDAGDREPVEIEAKPPLEVAPVGSSDLNRHEPGHQPPGARVSVWRVPMQRQRVRVGHRSRGYAESVRSRGTPILIARAVVVTVALCAGIVGLLAAPSGAQEPVITASPASFALEAGASQVVEFRLSEPIIARPGEPAPAFVMLALTPTGGGSVELSAPSVTWLATGWHEVRSVTVRALSDDADPSGSVELAGAVVSNSDFYDGRVLSVAVEVTSAEPALTTTVPAGPAEPAAPPTGAVEAPDRALAPAAPPRTSGAAGTSPPTELALTGPPAAGALAMAGLLLVAVGAVLFVRRSAVRSTDRAPLRHRASRALSQRRRLSPTQRATHR